ncbi:uncharacterized protein TNCV_1450521 [Trichonephila clavipes]|nr:uncharacterized protein TNCV_1450521 [Trichonephila clavipes]
MLRHNMKYRGLVMGPVDRTRENPKDLGKPRVRRVRVVIKQGKAGLEDPRLRRKKTNIGDLITLPRDHSPLQVSADTRQCKPPTEGSRQGASVQYGRARETRTTPSGGNSATERRPVRSRQATAVRPPYYLRSRLKKPEGIPDEQWNRQYTAEPQDKKPQHGSLRRRSGV